MDLYHQLVARDLAFTAYRISNDQRIQKIVIDTYKAICKNCISPATLASVERNPRHYYGARLNRIFEALDSMQRHEQSQ